MTDIKILIKQRSQIKSQVTKFKNHVMAINVNELNDTVFANLECRFVKFDGLWEAFDKVQSDIELLKEDEPESERDHFEKNYFEMQAKAKCILNKKSKDNLNSPSTSSNNNSEQLNENDNNCNIRLPVITLPTFKGSYEGWYNFKEIFEALISNNAKLSNVQKYYYLKASLKEDAAHITENLEINDSSFDIAWRLLKGRFENKRLIVHNYIQSILDMPSSNKESLSHLRVLQDTTIKNVQSLKHIGIDTDSWNVLITHIITNKFDLITRKEWEKYPLENELPTIEELLQFIAEKCSTLETLEVHKTETRTRAAPDVRQRTNTCVAVTQQACPICKQSHQIYYCETFKNLAIQKRIEEIKKLNLCLNCLKGKHTTYQCRHTNCRQCGKKHNSLLHLNVANTNATSSGSQVEQKTTENLSTQNTVSYSAISKTAEVILSTAIINVYDNDGIAHRCKCLLDTGSQSSFISENLVKTLRIQTIPFKSSVVGISQVNTNVQAKINVKIESINGNFSTMLSCLVLPRISEDLPAITSSVNVPKNIKLADPEFRNGGSISLLIGSDSFWNLLFSQQIKLGHGHPVLQKSKLGWILAGPIHHTRFVPQKIISNVATISNSELNRSLTKFWETEQEEYTKHYSPEELECESHFIKTHSRTEDGRFVVRLPFNEKITQLGDSRQSALKRFYAVEKRLNKNPELKQNYLNFMQEYEQLNHMQRIENTETAISYYIPHHAVFKDGKIRVVFDASNKSESGISLNDAQFTGPAIHNELFSILISFRKHDYVLSCDIVKMFRQILVHQDDRCFQKILWRYDSAQPIQCYELNTVVFGMTASPYLAIRCVQELANTIEHTHPDIALILKNQIYVDDILCGARSVQDLLSIKAKLIEILKQAGFELSKFNSNIQSETVDSGEDIVKINSFHDSKTLGIRWDTSLDRINYSFAITQCNQITKRNVLSEIAQLWDPLGILGPVIITAKMFIQKLWNERLSWDEPLPADLSNQWIQFRNHLPKLNEISIARQVLCKQATYIEIHGFADASEQGYGACIYLKSKNSANDTSVQLLCAKSKVAPVKIVSLPRLELCAAVLLSKLLRSVGKPLGLETDKRYLWSDSTITLHWIGGSPHRWKTYVANRVTTVQNLTDPKEWRHIKSKDNPADIISRGLTAEELLASEQWFHGPPWLSGDESEWPISQVHAFVDGDIPEIRTITNVAITPRNELLDLIELHGDLFKLQSIFAYILRFVHNLKAKRDNRMSGRLKGKELDEALLTLIKLVQIQEFPRELSTLEADRQVHKSSNLLSLNPFLDGKHLLRVGGRLTNANLPYDQKFPILLPSKHALTKLIFRDLHVQVLHCGPQLLLSTVRQRFWPISGASIAKETVRKCIKCFKAKPRGGQYIMGNLPADRITPCKPFSIVGTDFCGPFFIKDRKTRNRSFTKTYICVFVCFATKACHLEIVGDLTTEAFLSTFKRFIARRGKCIKIYSDNGTNYVGANREIQDLYKFIEKNETLLYHSFLNLGLTWVFSPARTPNFGGLFEACVKSTKFHLRRSIGESKLTYEEFLTLVTQVEACLNSRPISPLSNDPNDLIPLTPGHFLVGGPLTAMPEYDYSESKENALSRWQLVQKMTQHFWKRWSHEYLHQLQSRSKWKVNAANPIAVGDLVLIRGETSNTLQWPTGRVVQCHTGSDGVTRVLSLKTSHGVIKRGVTKVFKLPIECQV